MPWRFPPYCASLADRNQPPGDVSGRHESAALLQRLLRANLSPFEPNPIAALQRAEAEHDGPQVMSTLPTKKDFNDHDSVVSI